MPLKRRPGVPPAQRKSDRGRDQRDDTRANKSRSVSDATRGQGVANNPADATDNNYDKAESFESNVSGGAVL